MIIETSKDLLFVVIAFCILWVTIFFCWLLYYFITTAKRMHDVVKSGKDKLDKIGDILDLAKQKINDGASYVGALIEGVIKVADYFKKDGVEEKAKKIKKILVKGKR